jgi:hypothetical protein
MSVLLSAYTKALKSYDRELFAGMSKDGLPCVFRRSKRFEVVYEEEGVRLLNLVEGKQYVCAITDNWTATGKRREWGIDDVVDHIRKIDVVANKALFDEMDAHNEKVEESKKRDVRNNIESFWIDQRRAFQKATEHVLTHSMSKDEPRKRLKDRSIKNAVN